MNVPAETLEQLKCHKCEMYLSRGPVYLEHGGAAACGLCFSPKRPATRNKEYEAVAKLLRFPCKNRDLGCRETVGFEEVAHEARCSYRQYVCPVLGSSRCEWLGTRSQLLQHCQEQHPDHVLDNPCSLTHDISTSSLHNYLLQTFQLLFLLLTKVCVTSGRIYHSVRLLDSDDMAQDFTYTVHIKRNNKEFIDRGDVAPGGCLALQEPTALGLDVNSLLSVLGGWSGATCTVEVERRGRKRRRQSESVAVQEEQQQTVVKKQQQETVAVEEPEPEESEPEESEPEESEPEESEPEESEPEESEPEECSECGAEVAVKLYRDEGGWQCERCAPTRRACENQAQGCTHQDIPDKCDKHEEYFCQQGTVCHICPMNVSRGTLSTHYTSRHRDVTHSAGSTWRATRTDGRGRHCLVTCPAGTAVCEYVLSGSVFILSVYIPVSSERLCEFRCEIRVTQPSTGLTHTYTPDVTYQEQEDWRIVITKKSFPTWTWEFDISVNICKLQNN